MGNGNRHPVASKAQVAAGPDQVSGIVVHITGACPPGRGGGIIPVVFQAVVVAELNQQGWIVKAIAIVGGTERADCVIGHFFKSVGCFEKDACIFSLIPAPHNVCNLPDMVTFASGNDIRKNMYDTIFQLLYKRIKLHICDNYLNYVLLGQNMFSYCAIRE